VCVDDSLEALLQRAYRYALSLTHKHSWAEDLVQEACVRISKRRGPWDFAYIRMVIKNIFIDQYRKQQKISFQSLESATIESNEPMSEELDEDLEKALGQLRPEEREMLYLNAVENYSAAELAQLAKRPRGTILSMIHRAKEKLRRCLAEKTRGRP
jgi:RNA polymerase sigma factor (sigma-70 family)